MLLKNQSPAIIIRSRMKNSHPMESNDEVICNGRVSKITSQPLTSFTSERELKTYHNMSNFKTQNWWDLPKSRSWYLGLFCPTIRSRYWTVHNLAVKYLIFDRHNIFSSFKYWNISIFWSTPMYVKLMSTFYISRFQIIVLNIIFHHHHYHYHHQHHHWKTRLAQVEEQHDTNICFVSRDVCQCSAVPQKQRSTS